MWDNELSLLFSVVFVFKTGLRLFFKNDRSSMPRKLYLFLVFPLNVLSGS